MKEKRRIRILIAGAPTYFASNLSMSTFDFFVENKVDFDTQHVFSSGELFEAMKESWDMILVDSNLDMGTFLMEAFISLNAYRSFWLFFFDSVEERELSKDLREKIFKLIREGVSYG